MEKAAGGPGKSNERPESPGTGLTVSRRSPKVADSLSGGNSKPTRPLDLVSD